MVKVKRIKWHRDRVRNISLCGGKACIVTKTENVIVTLHHNYIK